MSFPGSPKILKGAVVGVDPLFPLPTVIVFQYNPDELTRTLKPRVGGTGERITPQRIHGAPVEAIAMDIRIDATDQPSKSNPDANAMGIYPQLSALEMLVYPSLTKVIADTALLAVGAIEIIPPAAPLTLLIWGMRRVVPILLQDYNIHEEMYDAQLNPIRASLALSMRVLTYSDMSALNPGYPVFMVHQTIMETMAGLATIQSLNSVLGSGTSIV